MVDPPQLKDKGGIFWNTSKLRLGPGADGRSVHAMLGTNRLRVFQQVARSGSLAGAARALSYTQPAVAHHVSELEREVGTALVVRHGRGVRLTEAGAALAAHADAVLSRLAAAQEEVAAIAGLRAGRVRIAAYPTAAATLVPPALARLLHDHPAVEVSLEELEPPEALASLQAGEVDLAVTFGYPEAAEAAPETDRDLALTVLGDDPIEIVVPATHPAAAHPQHRLADLAGETWVAGCDRCRSHLVETCREAGFTPTIAFTTDDFVTQQALVAAGLAVAAMPRSTLGAHADPGVRAAPCAELGARRVTVAAIGDPLPPAVAALRDRLSAVGEDRLDRDRLDRDRLDKGELDEAQPDKGEPDGAQPDKGELDEAQPDEARALRTWR
jgi:DNA-binding transcriptional LysR family regulator